MATVKPKSVVTINATGTAVTHARTDVSIRDLTMVVDEPERLGGTNQGPSPTESLVGALIGCLNVVSGRIADKLGIEIEDFAVEVAADFDRRGVTMEEAITVPFPKMDVAIAARIRGSDDQIAELQDELKQRCPLSTIIRQAGTELTETWTVTKI